MKRKIITAVLASLFVICGISNLVWAQAQCNKSQPGKLLVSPATADFYLAPGRLTVPLPVTVTVGGWATNSTVPITDFCWQATKNARWILLNGSDVSSPSMNTQGTFTITVDPAIVAQVLGRDTGELTGNVTVTSNLSGFPSQTIPVRVIVQSAASTTEPPPTESPPSSSILQANEVCGSEKPGKMVITPSRLQFYLSAEEMKQPDPIEIKVDGYALPQDDGCDTAFTWKETTDFCWTAAASQPWLLINGRPSSMVSSPYGGGDFSVTIDPKRLFPVTNTNSTRIYTANITITSTLTDFNTQNIPVYVYINSVREAGETSLSTTDWLDLYLKVPIAYNQTGALYILMEHPTLAPGQVFAYRLDANGDPTFTLFSQNGVPVKGAEKLYYTKDVQNTPIAIPFSSDKDSSDFTRPYQVENVESNSTKAPKIKAYIPVAFGKGLRMVGMEGDMIIRAVVGDPEDITHYDSWKELLYYVVHVYPISGDWVVTEKYKDGSSFTYIDSDTGTVFPLELREERGKLSGDWQTTPIFPVLGFTVNYSNPGDEICDSLTIQGHRFEVTDCAKKGGYDIYFSQDSLDGMRDYYYHIDSPSQPGSGYIEGTWQWRYSGTTSWSIPEKFTAVRDEIEIAPDPNDNLYRVNGTYNGVGTQFIVDTGASEVTIHGNPAIFKARGWDCTNTTITSTVANGATVTANRCYLDITLENRITVKDVPCSVSESFDDNLLGDTFLSRIHVSIGSDGHMILSK